MPKQNETAKAPVMMDPRGRGYAQRLRVKPKPEAPPAVELKPEQTGKESE